MSQQCIEKGAFDMDAVGSQNLQVKFQMMPYLLCGAFQERPDCFQIRRTGDRHVPCLVRFSAKGDAQQVVHEGFRPVVSVSKHQESYFSSSAAMAERASGVSAIIYSCLKSSTVFKWRSSNKSICPEPFCRTPDTGAEGFADEGCSVRGREQTNRLPGGGFSGLRRFFPEQLGLHGPEFQLLEKGLQFFRLGSLLTNSGRVTVRGTFRSMVASCLERVAMSPFSSTICLRFPFSLSVLDSRFSTEPNSLISSLAVFFPHAGKPRNIVGAVAHQGQNINYLVRTFNAPLLLELCQVNHFVVIAPLPGFHRKQVEEISWPRSLSWETM